MRVLLADDHRLFREGLCGLLQRAPRVEVVAEVADGREAVQSALEVRPHVVLLDVAMRGMNGIQAARHLAAELPDAKILCLSMHAEEHLVKAMLEAGAQGYLLKDCDEAELLRALQAVAAGQVYLSAGIGRAVLGALRASRSNASAHGERPLTAREEEVLQLIAEGHSSRGIAGRLGLSVKTINTHRERLMDKLEIHSVAGLTKYAIRQGYTSADA